MEILFLIRWLIDNRREWKIVLQGTDIAGIPKYGILNE